MNLLIIWALGVVALASVMARSETVRAIGLLCGLLLTLWWTPAMPLVIAPAIDAVIGGYSVPLDPWHEQHCWWIHKIGYRCVRLSTAAR